MTCRNEIAFSFKEKSRNDLLDYVCDRIDKNERDLEELWNCIGMTLAYLETKDFSQTFESITNENYIREEIKNLLKTNQQHCIEHYKENWLNKFKKQRRISMGLFLTNGIKDVKIGYIGFGNIRMSIANSISDKIGKIYKKSYIEDLTQEDIAYLDKNTPKYLDKFLWHSDCDVKGIYKELIKLKPIFNNENLKNKYKEILDLFSQEERIDFY